MSASEGTQAERGSSPAALYLLAPRARPGGVPAGVLASEQACGRGLVLLQRPASLGQGWEASAEPPQVARARASWLPFASKPQVPRQCRSEGPATPAPEEASVVRDAVALAEGEARKLQLGRARVGVALSLDFRNLTLAQSHGTVATGGCCQSSVSHCRIVGVGRIAPLKRVILKRARFTRP